MFNPLVNMVFVVKRHLIFILLLLLCLSASAMAAPYDMVDIQSPARVGEGKPFLVRIASWYPLENVRVHWNGQTVRPTVVRDGDRSNSMLLLGIGLRGELGKYSIEVVADIWGHERRFSKVVEVMASTWGAETLRVAPKMVTPPEEERARIEREREQIRAALGIVSSERYWEIPFSRPAKGKMLSRFGLHRVFNGHTKSRHTGLDFRAWLGTPLYAMAAGKVVLTGSFYYAGNAVFIDHGNGLISLYAHMSKTLVGEGDMVEAGQKIGLSGATGRVTGAHLHLATFVLGEVVDPELFFDGSIENKEN